MINLHAEDSADFPSRFATKARWKDLVRWSGLAVQEAGLLVWSYGSAASICQGWPPTGDSCGLGKLHDSPNDVTDPK